MVSEKTGGVPDRGRSGALWEGAGLERGTRCTVQIRGERPSVSLPFVEIYICSRGGSRGAGASGAT